MWTLRTRCAPGLCFVIAACLFASGCSSGKNKTVPSPAHGQQSPDNGPAPGGPDAKIHISYSHPGDFLSSLTVTEYAGAETVLSEPGKGPSSSIIRFDGGVVIWQIGVEKKLLADVPLLGERKPYAITEVIYGKLPANFAATVPDSGPPSPLEADHYYVFTVTRASGTVSYEAVKVNGDGGLEAYEAEPRAGDSFRLCCDISPDFVVNAMTTPGSQ
jgi:hypothetical protein